MNKETLIWIALTVVISIGGYFATQSIGQTVEPDKNATIDLTSVMVSKNFTTAATKSSGFDKLDVVVKDINKSVATLYYWGREGYIDVSVPDIAAEKPSKIDENTLTNKSLLQQYSDKSIKMAIQDEDPNSFEFDIIIESYPKEKGGNVFTFKIDNYENLSFYYQPPLYEEYGLSVPNATCNATDCNGSHRPENIVGSYAVYGNKRDNEYTTGKIFHIYRPKIIAVDGKWIYGNLSYFDGTLTVTVDDSWLSKAKYPIVIDPTYGKTTVGASQDSGNSGYKVAPKVTISVGGYATSINFYTTTASNYQVALYSDSSGHPDALLINSGSVACDAAKWCGISITSTLVTGPTNYWMALETQTDSDSYKYDTGIPPYAYNSVSYGSWSDPFGVHTDSTAGYSVYVNVSEANTAPSLSNFAPANNTALPYSPLVVLNVTYIDAEGSAGTVSFVNSTNNAILCTNTSISNNTVVRCGEVFGSGSYNKWYVNASDGTDVTTSGVYNFSVAPNLDVTQTPAPTGFICPTINNQSIYCSWNAQAVNTFMVFKNGTNIANTTNTFYNDTGLTNYTSYSHYIKAYNTSYNIAQSNATTQLNNITLQNSGTNTPPTTPTGISCNGGTCNATFSGTVNMQCSGSTDIDEDTITYNIWKGNASTTPASCGGSANVCTTYNSNQTKCGASGCDWNTATCTGTPDVCADHATEETCGYDAGCDWVLGGGGSATKENATFYPDDFKCTIRASGGDFANITSWESAIDSSLIVATSKVYTVSSIGTFVHSDDGSAVTFTGGGTGTLMTICGNVAYVTGVSGTVNTGVVTISGSGHTFTISDTGQKIRRAVAILYNDWPLGLVETVTIDGSTTNATNYVWLHVPTDQRHNGTTRNATGQFTGFALAATGSPQIAVNDPYTEVEGLILNSTYGTQTGMIVNYNAGDYSKIHDNILVNYGYASSVYNGITFGDYTYGYVYNNIFIYSRVLVSATSSTARYIYVYGNTFYNTTLSAGNDNVTIAKNNICYGGTSTTPCIASAAGGRGLNIASDYNILSGDGNNTELGEHSIENATIAQIKFENTEHRSFGQSFRLLSGSIAIDVGSNLSLDPSFPIYTDIDAINRTSPWDVGADEYGNDVGASYECTGTPDACTTYAASQTNCERVSCTYASAGCSGTPDTCTLYSNQTGCADYGCSWSQASTVYTWFELGNHTAGSSYSWNTASDVGETYEYFRCRAIDLTGSNTWSQYFNMSAACVISAAGDSCTYSGTGNWNILCSDNCQISTSYNLGGNNVFMTGTGSVLFTGGAKPKGFTRFKIEGTSSTNRCLVRFTG